jgi:dihydroflavonol-4-reductase
MRIAVTGADGHIGATLVRNLVAAGHDVRAVIHPPTANPRALQGVDVERVEGDVRDLASLHRAFAGAEVVFHLAAVISIDGDRKGLVRAINVVGALNAAEASLGCGVRRHVHVSSVHAFDHHPVTEPLDESRRRPGPRHPTYDRTKAAGEAGVRTVIARGLNAVIVNPAGVVGPRDFLPSRMGRVIVQFCNRKMPATANGGFDWVDVRDVARSIEAAGFRGEVGQNYLLPGTYLSGYDFFRMASQITGIRAPMRPLPRMIEALGADALTVWGRARGIEPLVTRETLHALRCNMQISGERAKQVLGHTNRPIEDTIRDTCAWFAHAGYAPHLRDRFSPEIPA